MWVRTSKKLGKTVGVFKTVRTNKRKTGRQKKKEVPCSHRTREGYVMKEK